MKFILIGLLLLLVSGCAGPAYKQINIEPAASVPVGVKELENLPPIDGPIITIAVYGFADKTGQRKPSTNFSQLSTAVTQGADSMVIQALQNAGNGKWFKVLERAGLDNLVKERQLIRSTREIYDKSPKKLKPMLFAGLLLDGAIVGYDSNIRTGGVGARYFGIGATKEYRTDRVSLTMRVVSVNTGEILLSVTVDKTIASYKDGTDVFRFLDVGTRALEIEIGSSMNEPVNYAVQCAIEQAVVEIVKQGEKKGLWKFKKTESTVSTDSGGDASTKDTVLQTKKFKKLPVSKPDINDIPKIHINELGKHSDDEWKFCGKDNWCFKNTEDLYRFEYLKKKEKGQSNNKQGDNQ